LPNFSFRRLITCTGGKLAACRYGRFAMARLASVGADEYGCAENE
jgi:hypothetical protein